MICPTITLAIMRHNKKDFGFLFSFFAELLSRLAFILKAYISNFGDFQRKYKEVREKLESLNNLSKKVTIEMSEMLKEVSIIIPFVGIGKTPSKTFCVQNFIMIHGYKLLRQSPES